MSSSPAWEGIKEGALQNENLAADVRVGDNAVQVNAPGMLQRFKVAIGWEKAPVYASKEETLTNLREQFGLDFSQKLRTLIQETGIRTDSEEYRTLVTHAMQSFDVITQKLTTTINTDSVSTSQAIQEAHLGSLNSLALLRQQFATPQLTPQFCKMKDGKWSVLQPAPHPENFVLSGGGVKGAGYVGWFKAAEQFGVLKNLKRIAGSSAGAITAAMIACGMSAEDFEKATDRTSFFSILTGTSRDAVVTEDTILEPTKWFSSFTGTYAVDHVNQEMLGSIKKYFQLLEKGGLQKKVEEITSNLSKKDQQALLTLEKAITPPPRQSFFGWLFSKKQPERPTHMVTFKELSLLAKIDSRFKELTVTAYDVTQKKEIYYNAENYPDQQIAEAVRASMSLPLIFQPMVDSKTGDVLEDGAIGSNIPVEVFVRNEAAEKDLEQARAKTLVLGFDNNGRFYDITSKGIIHKPVGFISTVVSSNSNFQKSADYDAIKLYDAGPNAMNVEHGTLDTTSFMASKSSLHTAQRQAEIRATEAFSLRQDQAVDHVFDSLEKAMEGMRCVELKNIIDFYDVKPPLYDSDYEKKALDGDVLPLSTEARRAMSQILSKNDSCDIVQAAKEELALRSQAEFVLS